MKGVFSGNGKMCLCLMGNPMSYRNIINIKFARCKTRISTPHFICWELCDSSFILRRQLTVLSGQKTLSKVGELWSVPLRIGAIVTSKTMVSSHCGLLMNSIYLLCTKSHLQHANLGRILQLPAHVTRYKFMQWIETVSTTFWVLATTKFVQKLRSSVKIFLLS